jgi:energy-coupling factor transport system ATP-binding protein
VLEATNLWFGYPHSPEIVKGISLTIEPGKRLAIAGENGSGKTTLARLLCGLLKPIAGAVTIGDLNAADPADVFEVRRRAGIVFQDPDDQLVEVVVDREIGFGLRNLGLEMDEIRRRVDDALRVFGIEHLRTRPCHLLSAGEKQTVTIASIFAMRPDYVILDESTSLLDAGSRRRVLGAVDRLLAKTGAGLGFISMRIEDIWTCDEVIFLKHGRVDFRGTREEILSYLGKSGIPLYGLPALVAKLEPSVPGLARALSRGRDLSAAGVADALAALAGAGGGGDAAGRSCNVPKEQRPDERQGDLWGGGARDGGGPCP